MPSDRIDTASLFVFVATVALAFKGVLARFAYEAGLSVDAVLLIRFGVAAPLFWLGVRLFAGERRPVTGRQWMQCGGAGLLFFVATYADFTAGALIGASLSRLVLFTFPVFVVLFNALLHHQPPSFRQLLIFTVTYAGLALAVAPEGVGGLQREQVAGVAWAFLSALTYALYLIASQPVMKAVGSARFTAASGSATLVIMLLFLLLAGRGEALQFTLPGFGWATLIAVACTVLPFFLLFEGIRRCGASRASLIALSGPAITVVAAWLLLGEVLVPLQIGGLLLVMAGIVLLARSGAPAG